MIDQRSIEQLKNLIDISDIIGSRITLNKSGSDLVGICPFHDDTKPSLRVSVSKGLYHCFACGAGGDAIKFIMEYDKLNYPEAVEKIAAVYNYTLSYTDDYQKPKFNKLILENVNVYYKSLLYKNQEALNYLRNRNLDDSMIEKWELGWAPNSNNTINLLKNEEIDLKDALRVGIIKSGEQGMFASFINRITFPIYNHLGTLVGFGGRTISDHPAKYVNSPQSEIFDKSQILFGFDKAKDTIHKSGEIIICEGYMDCIMLHQAGFSNVVAVLGTALTQKHISLLRRTNAKVILSFDSDKAGQEAAYKSAYLLVKNKIDGKVVLIGGGKDPAELIADGKINELRDFYSGGTELGEFYIKKTISNLNPKTPLEISNAAKIIKEFLFSLDPVVISSYSKLASELLGVDFMQNKYTQKQKISHEATIQKDLLELSVLKNMLERKEFFDFVMSDVLIKDEADEFFYHHKEAFHVVCGSQNINNPLIRELSLDNTLETYKNLNELQSALIKLKISFCDRRIKQLQNSNLPDKTKEIFNWQKLKQKIIKESK